MKRQPGWMATLAAVFLCLCAMMPIAPAQTLESATYLGTYYQTKGSNTLVLRLMEFPNALNPTGKSGVVFGSVNTLFGQSDPDSPLWEFFGPYDVATRQIQVITSQPVDAVYTGEGILNPATNSFSITFFNATSTEGLTEMFDNVKLDTGDTPYMVGIWRWKAAATNSGLLGINPPYGGQFHITSQDPDGRIRGAFAKVNPGDVGTLDGRMSGNQINFTRSGKDANGVDFVQAWGGTLTEDKLGILGVIEQNNPVPWSGDFEANWPQPGWVPRR